MADTTREELLIAGAGPSGLILAGSCARAGLAVTVVAPQPSCKWTNSYGIFEDQLATLSDASLKECILSARIGRYSSPLVWGGSERPLRLNRVYLRLSTTALQEQLLSRAREAGIRFEEGKLSLQEAQASKQLVIDATGQGLHPIGDADAYQYAYGKWIRAKAAPFADGEMALMDYRGQTEAPASFLYAMEEDHPEFGRVVFVQETVVASAEPIAFELLQARLERRLSALSVVGTELDEEFCKIPLGRSPPPLDSKVIPFGAAAAFVHPATGYQLAHSLHLAGPLTECLLGSETRPREERIQRALQSMWPARKRRAHELYRWAASIMASLTAKEMVHFIEAFFSVEESRWRGFMDGTLESREIFSLMARVFGGSSFSLRRRLLGRAAKNGGLALQALFPKPGPSPLHHRS